MTDQSNIYKRLLRTAGWTLLSLIVVLIVFITLLFNSAVVQKKVVDWSSTFLKDRYDIGLSVESIHFKPFNQLHVKKLLLGRGEVDSMIYISEGDLSFNANPLRLLRGELTLSGLDADSLVLRLLSNYTPTLPDTASKRSFNFYFSPTDIHVNHVDFNLTDTVRHMQVFAESNRVSGKVRSSNLKDQFSLEDVQLNEPNITVFGAKTGSGENPYIRKLWHDFRVANGLDTVATVESDSLFWALDFDVNGLEVNNGQVEVHAYDTVTQRYGSPLRISHLSGQINSVETAPNLINARYFTSRFTIGDSIVVKELSFDEMELTGNQLRTEDLVLRYGQSDVAGKVTMQYDSLPDFRDFLNKVQLDFDISSSEVFLADLEKLLPTLGTTEYVKNNRSDSYKLAVSGHGVFNDLTLSNWRIQQGRTYAKGRGRLREVLTQENRQINARIGGSSIPVSFIRRKFPDINLPNGVDSLSYVSITGRIDVDGKQLDIDANARTKLGQVGIVAGVDLLQKKYRGNLALKEFDLGRFIANPNIGDLSMTVTLEEGADFDLSELSGHLQTTVDSFYFKGYNYSGVSLNGFFGNNGFLGHVAMKQPEIAFDLDTKIDFERISDVVAFGHIHHADLEALNLSRDDIELSGEVDVDMTMYPIDSLNGYARINDLQIERGDSVQYSMNVITFDARSWGDNFKDWKLVSDILSVDIDGQFNIENILGTTYGIISSRHPRIVKYLPDMELRTDTIYNNDFTMIIDVNDTEEFSNLLNPDLDTIRNLNLSLTYRNRGRDYFEYYFQTSAPKIQFRDINVESLNVNASGSNTDNEWIVYLDSLTAGDVRVGALQLNTTLVGDQLDFAIQTRTINNVLNSIHLAGANLFEADEMKLTLDSSSFDLLNRSWVLNPNNYIAVGEEKLFFDNFVFQSGTRNLYIQSATDQSLIAGLRDIDIEFLNEFFPNEKYTFDGTANVVLSVENVFDLTGLEVETIIDNLTINNQPFGDLHSLFYTLSSDELATVSIEVEDQNKKSLDIDGHYDLFNKANHPVPVFDFDVRANQFPILVLEFFLGNIIENTKGYANAKVELNSTGDKPNINGRVLINGQTDISLLGTTYEFINSSVNIDNELISFGEINMMDKEGNLANASGGIRHDHLTNFYMDTRVTTEKFLLLNTGKSAGMPFYGRGLGSAVIDIRGPFTQLNMDIQAKTGPTSKISIPISSTISVSDEEAFFIDFVSDDSFEEVGEADDDSFVQIEGLNLEVDLTLTPDCEVSIILDESTGDILRARGNSELHIELTRAGNFTMRGTYEVVTGEYQFAQLNFTRKMFKINQGGTITWTGDPLNAKIDIDASYSVRTPPYNFILEYIGQNDRLADLAQNATDVDLFLHLRGDLFSPEITFDMEFPELTGQVKNYVEDRLRVIADDQNEINKQVFGLLVARSFIPSVSSVVNIDGTVVNTVSEVITNQISFFLTQYLQESIDEVPFISSVELNIGYNVYRNNYNVEAQNVVRTGNEFLVQPEFGFLEDRLQVTTEANLQTGSAVTANTLITHDFILEYSITKDNRLKAKLYQRTEPYVFEKTSKLGIGLSYQQEFDSFYEFLRGKRRAEAVQ